MAKQQPEMSNLHQQIVVDRLQDASDRLNLGKDLPAAFIRYAHSLILGSSVMTLDVRDIVDAKEVTDGGQEKQIDAFTIQESGQEAIVYITQTKLGTGFSSNDLILLQNGLAWCFEKSRDELESLKNDRLRGKIEDLRAVLKQLGPSRLRLVVSYVTTGSTSKLSDEFVQERRSLERHINGFGLADASVNVWGAAELVVRADEIDREPLKINADISIYNDRLHTPAIQYQNGSGMKGVICTVDAIELANLVNRDKRGFVFDWNIRQFLGAKGAVNSAIKATCTTNGRSELFWFLNNGITIVADQVEVIAIPDAPVLRLTNMQIVNGCQTASVLAAAQLDDTLSATTRVLVRAYQALGGEAIDDIVESTNTQNKITTRNLKANDRRQVEMQAAFRTKGYYYERKPRQYEKDSAVTLENLMSNEEVGQSYLAIVLKQPSNAGRRKYVIWDDTYQQVFGGSIVESYIVSTLLVRRVREWLTKCGLEHSRSDLKKRLAARAAYHTARIVGFHVGGGDSWARDQKKAASMLSEIQQGKLVDDPACVKAFQVLFKIVSGSTEFKRDLDLSLRSSELDEALDKALHRSRQLTRKH